MEQSDLLRYLVSVLDRLRIQYYITGSTASIAYGEPRFTNDIDVVVDLLLSQIHPFCASFPFPEYYLSEDAAREAVARRHQFNIIHSGSGLKIDVILEKETPFDRGHFARRRILRPADDYEASFSSPEDVILKKLQFYREGGSEKHLRDIAGILKISGDELDREYLDSWMKILGLREFWTKLSRSG